MRDQLAKLVEEPLWGSTARERSYETADAIVAALPDMVQLEWWEPRKDNNYTHGAKTIFGTYYVGQCGGRSNAHAEFFHESGDIEQFLGPDRGSVIEAQQDARRHYAGRILSAFGITGET